MYQKKAVTLHRQKKNVMKTKKIKFRIEYNNPLLEGKQIFYAYSKKAAMKEAKRIMDANISMVQVFELIDKKIEL